MFHGHLDYSQKPPLGGRPDTKLGDHGIPNTHNRSFIQFYHMWGPAWIESHLVEGPVTYDFTLHLRVHDHTTWFRRCLGTTFGHFLLGSHNFMVTGSWLVCEVAFNLCMHVAGTKHTCVQNLKIAPKHDSKYEYSESDLSKFDPRIKYRHQDMMSRRCRG